MKNTFLLAFILGISLLITHKVQAIGISPDKHYIDVLPGETNSKTFIIYGEAEQTSNLNIYLFPYTMKKVGEGDDREFYQADHSNENDPGNWVRMRQDLVDVAPASQNEVTFDYVIPESAPCGTSLAAIFLSNMPAEDLDAGSVVAIRTNVVMQIHFNVRGNYDAYCDEARTNLSLIEFKIDQFLPVYNWDGMNFVTRLENRNRYIARYPRGYIEIFGIGIDNKITINFNDEELDVYPETTRIFTDDYIDPNYPKDANIIEQTLYEFKNLKIGRYEARLGITAGTTDPIVAYTYFWIIPWKVILVSLAVLAIIYLYFKRKKNAEKNRK